MRYSPIASTLKGYRRSRPCCWRNWKRSVPRYRGRNVGAQGIHCRRQKLRMAQKRCLGRCPFSATRGIPLDDRRTGALRWVISKPSASSLRALSLRKASDAMRAFVGADADPMIEAYTSRRMACSGSRVLRIWAPIRVTTIGRSFTRGFNCLAGFRDTRRVADTDHAAGSGDTGVRFRKRAAGNLNAGVPNLYARTTMAVTLRFGSAMRARLPTTATAVERGAESNRPSPRIDLLFGRSRSRLMPSGPCRVVSSSGSVVPVVAEGLSTASAKIS